MAQQGLRNTVVDAQMKAMEMQRRSVHTDKVLWPDEATQQQPYCSKKMHVVLGDDVDEVDVDEVDVDAGVERARSTDGGRLNPDQ